jgi:hypothetical protein
MVVRKRRWRHPRRDEMIDRMVKDDIAALKSDVFQGDFEFLDSILRGEGWVPYNQLTDAQVRQEYKERTWYLGEPD